MAFALWEAAILIWKFPAFILPGPGLVVIEILKGSIGWKPYTNLLITFFEVVWVWYWGGMCDRSGLFACQISCLGKISLTVPGRQPGNSAGRNCAVVDHLVWTGIIFKNPDLLVDRLLSGIDQYDRWSARSS